MVLRYPNDLAGNADYVSFGARKYSSNSEGVSGVQAPGGGVVLYMPNSTPTMNNGQTWQQNKFEGPLGIAKREIAKAVAGAQVDRFTNGPEGVNASGPGLGGLGIGAGLNEVGEQMKNAPDIVRQGVISETARMMGVNSANQLMALSSGQVFNPNIELLYEGPQMRGYGFNFSFLPKDADEADTVRKIVRYFKVWSTPAENGKMYEIPYVFDVSYGGKAASFMNRFKRSALTSIGVQYNGGLDMHATFSNGCPIRTDISLSFMEVDVITRKEHMGPYY